ncbi:MAG: PAS domain S-box protein, partial [Gammaproteobacteria bacterium]|nr:PAS domain S-box protein [Gammaproteobacteria bacterium]
KKKNGDYLWILCRGLASFGEGEQPYRLSGSHSDISEQMESFEILKEEKRQQARLLLKLQEAQDNILQSEERLRYSQFFSNVGNMDWNIEKDELYLSELSSKMLGYRAMEQVLKIDELISIISEADREMVANSFSECRYKGVGYDLEYRIILPSGEERWVHGQGDAVRDKSGNATNILGMLQDITEKKRAALRLTSSVKQLNESNSQLIEAQDNLKKSTEWLQSILNIAPEAIIVFDSNQHITVFNRGAEAIFGYKVEEVIGKPLEILLPERFRDNHQHHVKSFESASNETLEMRSRSELQGLRKDGTEFPAVASVSKSGQGVALTFTVIIRDLTKQKEIDDILQKEQAEQAALIIKLRDAQEQLLQSEKLASIGQLAAGVAHEINNPVGYINSNLGSLQNYLNDLLEIIDVYQSNESVFKEHEEIYRKINDIKEEKDLEYLKGDIQDLVSESMEGVVRVKQIVQDLKDFSHAEVAEWHYGDIHKGINSTLNVAHNELKYKCDVVKEFGEIPEIECIISQLNQVFMNLLVNAAHAIEERGTVTVRTGVEGDGVWVEIEDTGKGMDEETKRRIFEPFFTTKPVGSGTGLGLSLSYGIIQKHNGTIKVDSEVGRGTKFHLWLPIKHKDSTN